MRKIRKSLAVILAVLMLLTGFPLTPVALSENEPDSFVQEDALPLDHEVDTEAEEMAKYLLDALEMAIQMPEPYALTDTIVFYGDTLDSWIQSVADAIANHGDELGGDLANLDVSALQGLTRADGDIHFLTQILQFAVDNAAIAAKFINATFDFGLLEIHPHTAEAIAEMKQLDFAEIVRSLMNDAFPIETTVDNWMNTLFQQAMVDFFQSVFNVAASPDEFDMTEISLYDFGLAVMSKLFDGAFIGSGLLGELLSELRHGLLTMVYPEASLVQVTDAAQLAAVEAEFYENYKYGDSAMWTGADGASYFTMYESVDNEDTGESEYVLSFYEIVFPEDGTTYLTVAVSDADKIAELEALSQTQPEKVVWTDAQGYCYFRQDDTFFRLITTQEYNSEYSFEPFTVRISPSTRQSVAQEQNRVRWFKQTSANTFVEVAKDTENYFYDNNFYTWGEGFAGEMIFRYAFPAANITDFTQSGLYAYAVTDEQEDAALRSEYKPSYGCDAWLDSQGRICFYYEEEDRFYIGLYFQAYYISTIGEGTENWISVDDTPLIEDEAQLQEIRQNGKHLSSFDEMLYVVCNYNMSIDMIPGKILFGDEMQISADIYYYQDTYYMIMVEGGSAYACSMFTTVDVREEIPNYFDVTYQPAPFILPDFAQNEENGSLWNYFDIDFTYKPEMFSLAEGYETYGGYMEQINHLLYQVINLLFTDKAAAGIGWQDGATAEVFNENLSSLALTLFPKLAEVFAAEEPYFADPRFSAESVAEMSFEELAVTALELMWTTLDMDVDLGITLPLGSGSLEQFGALAVKAVMESENGLAFPYAYDDLVYADAASGTLRDYSEAEWLDVLLTMAVDMGVYYLNEVIDIGLSPDVVAQYKAEGWGWLDFFDEVVDWAINLCGGVFAVSDELSCERGVLDGNGPWYKLSKILNSLLPMGQIFNNCSKYYGFEKLDFDLGVLICDRLVSDALDLDFAGLLSIFNLRQESDNFFYSQTMLQAALTMTQKLVNAICPGALTDEITVSVDNIFQSDTFAAVAENLLVSLGERKDSFVRAAIQLSYTVIKETIGCFVHEYGDWVITVPATCVAPGEKVATCLQCGNEKVETIPVTSHSYADEWTVVLEATCSEDGLKTTTCTVCGKTIEQTIAAGHVYENGVCQRCGKRLFNYQILEDGTAEITGYTGEGGDVTIPSKIDGYPVTSIGAYAFSDCEALTTVEIGDSVTTIGAYAFDSCDALTTVEIGNSVTTIGNRAFSDCDALTAITVAAENPNYSSDAYGVLYNKDKTTLIQYPIGNSRTEYTIPDSVTTIGNAAFQYCVALTSVEIGDNVTTIGDGAFQYCVALTTVEIPDSVTTIGDQAFGDCYALTAITVAEENPNYSSDADGVLYNKDKTTLIQYPIGNSRTAYTIPDSVTTIGDLAFWFCDALTLIVIPDSVTDIGLYAFAYCYGLTSVEIGNSVTTIGAYAFFFCDALTSIVIPDSVTTISYGAFMYCYALTTVEIGNSVTTIGDQAFGDCNALTSVEMGDSVTTIGAFAFHHCNDLISIVLPGSVTAIYEAAFVGCDALTTVYYTGTEEQWNAIGIGPLNDSLLNAELIFGDKPEIEESPFTYQVLEDGTAKITGYTGAGGDVTIPSEVDGYPVTSIGDYAFEDCTALTSIVLPDSVTTIGDEAFSRCSTLSMIEIPGSVTTIGDSAFRYCDALTTVCYTGTEEQWNAIAIDSNNDSLLNAELIFDEMPDTEELPFIYQVLEDGTAEITRYTGEGGDVTIPDTIAGYTVTTIGDRAFYYRGDLTSVEIGDSVTTIDDWAFFSCIALTSVEIPDSVTTIGDKAFAYCDALTTVKMGDSVTTIGDYAFALCSSLTTVEIGNSVTTIGDDAFYGCIALTSIVIPYNVTTIGDSAFAYCDALTTVKIGNSVTTIGDSAFRYCDALTTVEIGDSVTTIGDYAFEDCDALTTVEIPDSVTTIGNCAFRSCSTLTTVEIGSSVTTIGDSAFKHCYALTTVEIPDSVTTIGDWAFGSCDALTAITVEAENPNYSSDTDGVLYNKDKTTLIQYPIGNSRTAYTIPDSVTTIGDNAFDDCDVLTTVEIGDSVTTIGDWAFSDCEALTTVEIGDSVTTIGDSAFRYCEALTTVEIPDSVTTIGDSAFYDCSALTTVEIPDSVTTIGDSAFDECTALTAITVAAENPNYSSDADGVLYNKDKTTLIQYPIGNSRTAYTIPDSVTTIGYGAFAYCEALTTVELGDSVTTIGDSAFYDCYALTTVEMGDSVTTIGDRAFIWCDALTTVEIGDSVTTIGDSAFRYCDALTTVYYTGTEEQWNAIDIGSYNDPLLNAELIFGEVSDGPCADGHTEEVIPGKAATCTEPGLTDGKKCSVCGEILQAQEEIPALGHDFSTDWTIDKEATCTETGLQSHHCTRCDAVSDQTELPMIDHELEHVVIPSTCTVAGVAYDVCVICDNVFNETILPVLAHNWGVWETVTPAGCETTGEQKHICAACGTAETEALSALGHDFSDEWTVDKEATCTETGLQSHHCTRCDALSDTTEIPMTDHELEHVEIPSTCTVAGVAYDVCVICDHIFNETTLPLAAHSWGAWETVTPAGCEITGEQKHTCAACGTAETEVLPALGHDWETDWTVDKEATCTETGVKSHHCTRCDAVSDTTEIPMLDHELEHVEIPSTCTVAGVAYDVCVICDNIFNEATLPLAAHTWSVWETVTPAGCETTGEQKHTCSACGTAETEVLPALGHDWETDWTVDKEATCTETGVKSHHCTRCDAVSDTTEIPMIDHELEHVELPSTCTVAGVAYDVCVVCDNIFNETTLPLAEHSWGAWETVTPAGCETTGEQKHTCTVCGTAETEVLPALGHDWETDWTIDKEATCTETGLQSHHCTRCDAVSDTTEIPMLDHELEHVEIPSTCTVTGVAYDVCIICDNVFNETLLPVLVHNWGAWETVTPAGCETSGEQKHTCAVCGKEETEVLPALGHDWETDWTIDKEATCTETGLQSHHCTRCDAMSDVTAIPALGHTFGEWILTVEPTYLKEGAETQTCLRCAETQTRPVAKLEAVQTELNEETGISIGFREETYAGEEMVVEAKQEFDGISFQLLNNEKGNFKNVLYDITTTINGEKVQPDGMVLVKIPLPEGYNPDRTVVYFVANDGSGIQKLDSYYEDGYVCFETDHFSSYALVDESEKITDAPTGPSTEPQPTNPTPIEPEIALGDVDGDGKVTSADARLALRAAVKLETLEGDKAKAADVNNDDHITTSDARKILRVAVKLDSF